MSEGVKYSLILNPGSKCTPLLNNQSVNVQKHIFLLITYIIHLNYYLSLADLCKNQLQILTKKKVH